MSGNISVKYAVASFRKLVPGCNAAYFRIMSVPHAVGTACIEHGSETARSHGAKLRMSRKRKENIMEVLKPGKQYCIHKTCPHCAAILKVDLIADVSRTGPFYFCNCAFCYNNMDITTEYRDFEQKKTALQSRQGEYET